jgi:DEAD/DEAH box helicase domain-containing protein
LWHPADTIGPVDARGFLDRLSASSGAEGSLAHVRTIPARAPVLEPVDDLPQTLRERLTLLGVDGLYPHQRRGLDLLSAGHNVILATGTASGKTLVYNLAFAQTALLDEKRTALYVFPTKALARDQLRQVRGLRLPQVRAAVYDGDTPKAERPLVRRNANLVMTNPDMLHASILPGHERWADFLLRLSLVVVHEAHVARGVFGSHVAMVLRRLRRLTAHYGGNPQFVLASATVGNPTELAERLTGLPFDEVADDASPRGEKLFVLWNPPMVDEELGVRRGAVSETAWLLKELVESETTAIAFCRSRRGAELVAEFCRRELPGVAADAGQGLPRRPACPRNGASSSGPWPPASCWAWRPPRPSNWGSTSVRWTRRLWPAIPGPGRRSGSRPGGPGGGPSRRWPCWWPRTTRSTSTSSRTRPTSSTDRPRRW